jgi:hypothetical protein
VSNRLLRCRPAADPDFLAAAAEALAALEYAADAEVEEALADALRAAYPNVRVRRMDVIAMERPTDETWYVYRDGGSRLNGGSAPVEG